MSCRPTATASAHKAGSAVSGTRTPGFLSSARNRAVYPGCADDAGDVGKEIFRSRDRDLQPVGDRFTKSGATLGIWPAASR